MIGLGHVDRKYEGARFDGGRGFTPAHLYVLSGVSKCNHNAADAPEQHTGSEVNCGGVNELSSLAKLQSSR